MSDLPPASPDWHARPEDRRQQLRETISSGFDRVIALFNHLQRLNNGALAMNDIGVLTRLEAAERRLAAIEKHLNIPPTM